MDKVRKIVPLKYDAPVTFTSAESYIPHFKRLISSRKAVDNLDPGFLGGLKGINDFISCGNRYLLEAKFLRILEQEPESKALWISQTNPFDRGLDCPLTVAQAEFHAPVLTVSEECLNRIKGAVDSPLLIVHLEGSLDNYPELLPSIEQSGYPIVFFEFNQNLTLAEAKILAHTVQAVRSQAHAAWIGLECHDFDQKTLSELKGAFL